MDQQPNTFSLHIGLPTLFLVFISLCLISFATLTFTSANADWQLTQKVVLRTQNYYQSCNIAEEALADINVALGKIYQENNSESAYLTAVSEISDTLSYPVSDIQNLNIMLSFPYFKEKQPIYYQILSWKVEACAELEYDTYLNVIP